jgi:hypothetical protein
MEQTMPEGQEGKGPDPKSRAHDLFTSVLGGFAAFLLATLRLHIDTKASPYPFYKGPIIFPIIILSIMFISSLPSFYRLLKPAADSRWYVDGEGWPYRPAAILILLALFFLIGVNLIGVEISVFLFLCISIFFLKYRSFWINFVLPFIYTAAMISVFKYMFDVYFPKPWIFRVLGG